MFQFSFSESLNRTKLHVIFPIKERESADTKANVSAESDNIDTYTESVHNDSKKSDKFDIRDAYTKSDSTGSAKKSEKKDPKRALPRPPPSLSDLYPINFLRNAAFEHGFHHGTCLRPVCV